VSFEDRIEDAEVIEKSSTDVVCGEQRSCNSRGRGRRQPSPWQGRTEPNGARWWPRIHGL